MLLMLGFSGVFAVLIVCWIKIKFVILCLCSVFFCGVNILVFVLLILLVVVLFYKDYVLLFCNNKELVKFLSFFNSIVVSWLWYFY